MAKKLSEQVASVLQPFAKAIGENKFGLICRDVASMLGQQTITTVDGNWKTASGLRLSAKDTHKVQLPMNNPASHLFWFGIRLSEIATAGEFVIEATIPKQCEAWIENKEVKPEQSPA